MTVATILKSSADGTTMTMACHYTVPVGNNAVGVSWATALVNSGMAQPSVMTTGTGAGQISTADAAALTAGTLREYVVTFQILGFSALTTPQKITALTTVYNNAIAADQASIQVQLNFFGYTQ